MKRLSYFLMAAAMVSMVACTSAPKQEEATEVEQPATEQVDTTQAVEGAAEVADTTKPAEAQQ
ncbi:MAG: hypothetical protein H6536_08565 [Bacteroidales bacterium]|nr:hypothetical protein [Bacteroidales bacterium]